MDRNGALISTEPDTYYLTGGVIRIVIRSTDLMVKN
jgi:hypothetical protein